ncbi:hypothetical protein [Glaciecola sp. KUL10]|uniref:hypothetical protein n=1 Tax=Glaciecola sp. (strain KUL10) TaxID=2161813 RepID=UPI000D78C89A|nr:hypothetical protein [Glaciecola sp. KUL10]GBL03026.1 hypothetical protein KUL10_03030 [Glaciecola sp. KUL10]
MHSTSLRFINKISTNHDDGFKRSTTQMFTHHRPYTDDVENPSFVQYTLFAQTYKERKRWLANVSRSKTLKQAKVHAINVKPTANKDDFDVIRSLLIAKTCHTILFDKQFDVLQTKELKDLARFSGTKLAFIKDEQHNRHCTERKAAH